MAAWWEDGRFHLAHAGRAVGLGLVALAWTAVFLSQLRVVGRDRVIVLLAVMLLTVAISQLLARRPPSLTVVDMLSPLDKEMLSVAREQAKSDRAAQQRIVHYLRGYAMQYFAQRGALPRDRQRWFRLLAQRAVRGG